MRLITAVLLAASVFGATAAQAEMKLTSKDLTSGKSMADAQVFNSFGCAGSNISPELVWSAAPEGTKSFAVMAYDPDAPTGSGWWHWSVFNIPANVSKIATGASGEKNFQRVPWKATPTSLRQDMAAHARRPAMRRTTTSSPSTRSRSTSCRFPRPRPGPWLVSMSGQIRSPRPPSRSPTAAEAG